MRECQRPTVVSLTATCSVISRFESPSADAANNTGRAPPGQPHIAVIGGRTGERAALAPVDSKRCQARSTSSDRSTSHGCSSQDNANTTNEDFDEDQQGLLQTSGLARDQKDTISVASLLEVEQLSSDFAVAVSDHVDLVMATIEAEAGLALTVPVVVRDRPFVVVDGRAPFAMPTFMPLPISVSVGRSRESLPLDRIEQGVAHLRDHLPDYVRRAMSRAYGWLVMSLSDDDELRASLFAYVGIEGLAASLRSHAQPFAIGLLRSTVSPDLPIEELLWPRPVDADDKPNSSAVFELAIIVTALSPETAADDVATFKRLQKERLRIAHGTDHKLDHFPHSECRHCSGASSPW
jgi:hypothetical protein